MFTVNVVVVFSITDNIDTGEPVVLNLEESSAIKCQCIAV